MSFLKQLFAGFGSKSVNISNIAGKGNVSVQSRKGDISIQISGETTFISGSGKMIIPSGIITSKNLDVTSFKTVTNTSIFDVSIEKSNTPCISIKGDNNLIEHIIVSSISGQLLIEMDDISIKGNPQVEIKIYTPNLSNVKNTSVGNIDSQIRLSGKTIDITNSGTGKIICRDVTADDICHISTTSVGKVRTQQINANTISIKSSGTGGIDITSCTGQSTRITLSSVGKFECKKINSSNLSLNLSGTGRMDIATIDVNNEIDIALSGVGKLEVGDVKSKNLTSKISGTGGILIDTLKNDRSNVRSSSVGGYHIKNFDGDIIDIALSGTGSAIIKGKVRTLNAKLSSVGRLYADECWANEGGINVSGVGSARVNIVDIKINESSARKITNMYKK